MRYSRASPYCMGHPIKITLLVKNGLSDFLEYSYSYWLPACVSYYLLQTTGKLPMYVLHNYTGNDNQADGNEVRQYIGWTWRTC
jgi:hypothetical protein